VEEDMNASRTLATVAFLALAQIIRATDADWLFCLDNLRRIDTAKENAAVAGLDSADGHLSTNEAALYIRGGWPTCPMGGMYNFPGRKAYLFNPTCYHGDLMGSILMDQGSALWRPAARGEQEMQPYREAAYVAALLADHGPHGAMRQRFTEIAIDVVAHTNGVAPFLCNLSFVQDGRYRFDLSLRWARRWVLAAGTCKMPQRSAPQRITGFMRLYGCLSFLAPHLLREGLLDLACGRGDPKILNGDSFRKYHSMWLANKALHGTAGSRTNAPANGPWGQTLAEHDE
jgi:hypothetical protein